jgi:hypothetical protein
MASNSAAGEAWGFNTQAAFNSFITEMQAGLVDMAALNTLVNRLRTDLVTIGIIKGSA